MKRLVQYLAILAAAAITLSCYWTAGSGTGSIQLDLSAVSKGPGDRYARVWLIANSAIYSLAEDKDYLQEAIPGDEEVTLTIEDLPVGPVYRVWLSIVEEQQDWLATYVWGESAPFDLQPGTKVAVQFTASQLKDSYPIFQPVANENANMTGKKFLDVEAYGGYIYATDGSKLYEISNFKGEYTLFTATEIDAPSGRSINSLSVALGTFGNTYLCIDTDQGIYALNGGAFESPATSVNLGSVSVLGSGRDSYGGGSVLFFRRSSGWGGTYAEVESNPPVWIWTNRDSGRVTDLAVSQDSSGNGYFATADGAFRFSGEYLYKRSLGETPSIGDYKAGFSAPSHILSLAIINPETEVLLMGTENGAWSAGLTGDSKVIDTPLRVDGTQGYRINRIAAYYGGSYNFAAYMSDIYLLLWDDMFGGIYKCPLAAGLPGRVTGLVWYSPAASYYYLIVSGTEGLAYIEILGPM
jgi:hypothetical protein